MRCHDLTLTLFDHDNRDGSQSSDLARHGSHRQPGDPRQPTLEDTGGCVSNENLIATFFSNHAKYCLGGIANLDPVLMADARLVEAASGGRNGALTDETLETRMDFLSFERTITTQSSVSGLGHDTQQDDFDAPPLLRETERIFYDAAGSF